ncbi:MAG: type I DNA topoisomerase [Clostridia bacterium]|nr:type I DNA topoisomerase [Clostridia bacterium]
MATAKKILVIVESPSKAKTIGKYLGARYKVVASVGHVRDLPKSKIGIDIDNDFEPQYINIRGKGDLIKELKREAKKASKVYLATDPDREGEAISWHLAYILGIDPEEPCRIVFNEITKSTIKEAIKHPRKIDIGLVDAQQARRVLDRLVGYQISPILWRKVRKGLSAGRVQSAALKIICDREKEIQSFVPEEYWNIIADFKKGKTFSAKLVEHDKKKVSINNEAEANKILDELKSGSFVVGKIAERERTRNPFAPFTTSSMQQEASTKLNFNTRKTMMIAQQLYEGVEIKGQGTVGLITYLRTDSVRISDDAKAAAKEYITNRYGKEYLGNHVFSNKKKDIQDAHEAIRPSNVELAPEDIKDSLSNDQFKLYRLIWCRFLASQMSGAKFNNMQVDINNGSYIFKATGSKLLFDGYQKVYNNSNDDDKDKILPAIEEGETLDLKKIEGEQNFTQPPSRYTEAGLVKKLEEDNIGRPSTYAPIVSTLSERKYVKREKKTLIPTELGFIVTGLMEEYFKEIVDVGFTASMEDQLDDVEMNKREWKSIIRDFYVPFSKDLKIADEAIEKVEIEPQPTGEICELCGKPMVLKMGRFGEFIACSGYPECKNTKPIVTKIDVPCPKCGRDIVARKSKRGRLFYGCSGYPECDQSFWNKPVNKKCPKCGSLLVEKKTKAGNLACSNSECDYKE